ncbi:39S ribosomal protein L44, mitochondrial-like [Homarus americanus]|uniref:39S ribosomal protein L44, mitochondrial-like n=1 Tax=Homarus americanus TaxID=6706 RepID=UPI001C493820|nr:39S ribosomal protein L44, mitochondrial-like [Homarus americanus]
MSGVALQVASTALRCSAAFTTTRSVTTTACMLGIKSRWVAPLRKELYKRQKKMYKKGIAHKFSRSEFIEWNYDAELFAFGKRLHEEFEGSLLREALTDSSYIAQEMSHQQALGVTSPALTLKSNTELAAAGATVIADYCAKYLRAALPVLPEEGISALVEHLSSEEIMSKVGYGIGLKDLILCQDYPPSATTAAKSFQAVVGALNASVGLTRCQTFVRDFVVSQLVGKDISDIWQIDRPMELLTDILARSGCGKPEPRLMFQTGKNTVEAVYQVGIYSDKNFMGSGYGETVETAVAEAAYSSIKKLFQITESSNPLPFGKDADAIALPHNSNILLDEWSIDKAKNVVTC